MYKLGIQTVLLLISSLVAGQTDPYLAGRACLEQELYDSALVHFEEALRQRPGETDLYLYLGKTYFALRNYPAARDAFYEVEKRKKGMGSYYLAKSEIKLNHPQQALKYLRIHLSSRYKLPEAAILLDEDLSTLEGSSGWQQLWNEKEWYSRGDRKYQQALFLKDQGDYLEAINLLNELDKQGYSRSKVRAVKAAIYAELDNRKASRSELKAAVKSDVRNLDAVQQLALIQVAEGNVQEALTGLNRVIRQDPARFDAWLQRAGARSMMGDLSGAMEDMERYLTYFPEDHEALYKKGMIQYENRKYLDAIQSFNRALALEKGNAQYYFARGMTYAATGTTRYAEKDMSMALDLDPLNGEIWFEKGKLADQMGNRVHACHCYQKAYQYGVFEAGDLLNKNCR